MSSVSGNDGVISTTRAALAGLSEIFKHLEHIGREVKNSSVMHSSGHDLPVSCRVGLSHRLMSRGGHS